MTVLFNRRKQKMSPVNLSEVKKKNAHSLFVFITLRYVLSYEYEECGRVSVGDAFFLRARPKNHTTFSALLCRHKLLFSQTVQF